MSKSTFKGTIFLIMLLTVLGFCISFVWSADDQQKQTQAGAIEKPAAVQPAVTGTPKRNPTPSTEATIVSQAPKDTTNSNDKGNGAYLGLIILYVVLLVLFIFGLHSIDNYQAYKMAKTTGEKNPAITGIPGTTRAILTYAIFIVLGIAVFHLIVFSGITDGGKMADKILMVLSGSVASVMGFYFGTKATQEGVTAGKNATEVQPILGQIKEVFQRPASQGSLFEVTIFGIGFGGKEQKGNVDLVDSNLSNQALDIKEWNDTIIKGTVPMVLKGPTVDVTVNPDGRNKIIGNKMRIA